MSNTDFFIILSTSSVAYLIGLLSGCWRVRKDQRERNRAISKEIETDRVIADKTGFKGQAGSLNINRHTGEITYQSHLR